VNVNVKPAEGTARITFGGIPPVNMERVAVAPGGLKLAIEPAAIPKYPVDAEVDPGFVRVFAVVVAVMFGPGVRTAVPPFPGVNVKFPVAGAAYA
jgi:hypothetical protein